MSPTSTFRVTPGLGSAPVHAKPYPTADIVRIGPSSSVRSSVAEETDQLPPSWNSDVLAAALAICRRVILILQAEHTLSALNDQQLRDIGLSRDQVQPPVLTALGADRHLWRWWPWRPARFATRGSGRK